MVIILSALCLDKDEILFYDQLIQKTRQSFHTLFVDTGSFVLLCILICLYYVYAFIELIVHIYL